jgi:hypothetical protein
LQRLDDKCDALYRFSDDFDRHVLRLASTCRDIGRDSVRVFSMKTIAIGLGILLVFTTQLGCLGNQLEIEVRETKRSPDGKWTAVVQMEVYSSFFASGVAVYAVRLQGPAQKDRQGDLVMNAPVNYPDPEPVVEWSNGNLVVTLTHHQTYQYLATPVSGV